MFLFSFISVAFSSIQLNDEKSFIAWMRETNNFYTGDDYFLRYGIWLVNKRFVQEHNKKNNKYTLQLNHLSALTPAEYQTLLGSQQRPTYYHNSQNIKNTNKKNIHNASSSVDWRDSGVVSPIYDQGNCGSDWAFAAITTAESVHAVSSGKLTSLSVQNLMDCVNICYGCYGGLASYALTYVVNTQDGKISPESSYPYTASKDDCKYNGDEAIQAISGWNQITAGDEAMLSQYIEENGPAAAVIDGSLSTFIQYKSGIYDDEACSSVNVNHAVGVIGYGLDQDVSYWIVRNSLGTTWGEDGYMRLIWKDNRCGIASLAVIAVA